MGPIFFADLARLHVASSGMSALKSATTRLASELASGERADVAASLGGDLREILALRRTMTVNEGLIRAADETALRAEGQQAALGSLRKGLDSVTAAVSGLFPVSGPEQTARVAAQARVALGDALATLNSSIGGRSLFAGISPTGPAVIGADDLLARLETVLIGATSQTEMATRIMAWFDNPAGWATQGYRGGPEARAQELEPGGARLIDRTAADVRIRSAIAAFATAAFLDRTSHGVPVESGAAVHTLAGLRTANDGLVTLTAEIGFDQQRIATFRTEKEAEAMAVEMAIATRTSIDPALAAVELEAVQTNLETLYAVTARISRLSLADFIR